MAARESFQITMPVPAWATQVLADLGTAVDNATSPERSSAAEGNSSCHCPAGALNIQ